MIDKISPLSSIIYVGALLSGIVIAYLKINQYFKIFADTHTLNGRKKNQEKEAQPNLFAFFRVLRVRVGRFS